MRAIPLNQIPGYVAALSSAKSAEFRSREDNWLALPVTIAGRKVRVMTVRDYVALLRLQNPFVLRSEPTKEALGEFLRILSPEIERWHDHVGWRKPWLIGCRWPLLSIERWSVFLAARRLRRDLKITELEAAARRYRERHPGGVMPMSSKRPLARAMMDAFAYVDKIFLDRPAGIAKEGTSSGLLYLTSWFDAMQSEYNFTDQQVWKMELPRLFGRLKAISARHNPGEPEFNARQDALHALILKSKPEDLTEGRIKFDQN
jgi:hypothetical protein